MRGFIGIRRILLAIILSIIVIATVANLYTSLPRTKAVWRPSDSAQKDNIKICADCISYALHVNDLIHNTRTGNRNTTGTGTDTSTVRGNLQFFRYAVDIACRGRLLTSGRCLAYRRGFLKEAKRLSLGIGDPYRACLDIGACG